MISAVSWVPKGAAMAVPEVAEPPSQEEIEELLKNGVLPSGDGYDDEDEEEMDLDNSKNVDEVSQALAVANALGRTSKIANDKAGFDVVADGLRELNMENYDEEDEDIELFSTGLGDLYYPSNEMDPYLKHDDEDDDSEELDNIAITPMDSLIVCARTDNEVNLLEIYLLEQSDDGEMNMFIHHELVLSDFPLCTAWLDCPLKGSEKGNFIAVGSMGPAIEIWNLDTIDAVEPCCVLGGAEVKKKKKNKKQKTASIKYKEGSHTGSVLGIAWNKEFRNIIASAGGDSQVKIWDVAAGKCNVTMDHHTDKVQAVSWNHHAPQVLLSGSFDHSVVMKDGRIPTHSGYKWSVTADVESLAWDPHSEHSFVVSLEDGTIKGFDVRAAASNSSAETRPSFTLHAHDKAVSTVSYNPLVPNLLATGSLDKTVKVWDLTNNRPSCLASRNPRGGALFSISFSEDNPFMLAIGGSKGRLELWDTWSEASISQKYGSYSRSSSTKAPAPQVL